MVVQTKLKTDTTMESYSIFKFEYKPQILPHELEAHQAASHGHMSTSSVTRCFLPLRPRVSEYINTYLRRIRISIEKVEFEIFRSLCASAITLV